MQQSFHEVKTGNMLKTSLVKDDNKTWYNIELLLERNGVLHSEHLVHSLNTLHKADS